MRYGFIKNNKEDKKMSNTKVNSVVMYDLVVITILSLLILAASIVSEYYRNDIPWFIVSLAALFVGEELNDLIANGLESSRKEMVVLWVLSIYLPYVISTMTVTVLEGNVVFKTYLYVLITIPLLFSIVDLWIGLLMREICYDA